MPPGRRSISQSTVCHGAGVNHFLTSSGVVQAAQTRRGGTSTTRSSTRSSCGSGVCVILRVTRLLLECLQDLVQSVETTLPTGALRREPVFGGLERLWRKREDAHAALLSRLHEAA